VRFVAPERAAIDPVVFQRAPLTQWSEFADLLHGTRWPSVAALNERAASRSGSMPRAADPFGSESGLATQLPRFVVQSPGLLRDGLHYEQRIAVCGQIATRERNWHDLLNAMVWLRFPALKAALNARQVEQIALAGPKQRTRSQCALTLFDEAGVIVVVRDASLLASWDRHDWHALFWRERDAWSDGRIDVTVFGHALLEHALNAGQMLVGKGLVLLDGGDPAVTAGAAASTVARAIAGGDALDDPQALRPLPLSGIPGWHPANGNEQFYFEAPCFRPLRAGRRYPPPLASDGLLSGR